LVRNVAFQQEKFWILVSLNAPVKVQQLWVNAITANGQVRATYARTVQKNATVLMFVASLNTLMSRISYASATNVKFRLRPANGTSWNQHAKTQLVYVLPKRTVVYNPRVWMQMEILDVCVRLACNLRDLFIESNIFIELVFY
jgi:hypothetical protein